MHKEDTIAAISTAVSESGIGIIRISGPDSVMIADKIFRSPNLNKKLMDVPSHTMHYGHIYENGSKIDEVLVSVMRGPRSFTAEDTVEINCHGGVYGMRRVLECVLANGARAAMPGEFTKRAFLNGRIDLSQAEAVMNVISSKNEMALKNSMNQLEGGIFKQLKVLRSGILNALARIESALDDPEHYELDGFDEELSEKVREWKGSLQYLIESFQYGRMLQEGIRTVILGKPNAGKSSLLNLLLGEDRAIVTDIEGTTRDTLEETLQMGEITLRIVDTAGIRQTDDPIEKIGVERALEGAKGADMIWYVVDASRELDDNDRKIIAFLRNMDKPVIILLNKEDLNCIVDESTMRSVLGQEEERTGHQKDNKIILSISAREGSGVKTLRTKVRDLFFEGGIHSNDEIVITSVRHKMQLEKASLSLNNVLQSVEDGMPEDFWSIDLRQAVDDLGEITGETVGEDLVNEIFSKFCMGK